MKYLLIDANNLGCRSAFANEELTNSNGIPTGAHYGVFRSLINFKEKFPEHQFLMVWDSKSVRRKTESEEGVNKKLIKEAYKENRMKDELPKPLKDFYKQLPYLKKGIQQTGIPNIKIDGFEADDVVASFCKKLDAEEIICATTDKDYYQLLTDKVSMWNGMKEEMITKSSFIEKFGIQPQQHIDVGALMGDTGDNIFGVSGWGEKSALEAIQKHGTWQNVLKDLHEKFDKIREQYPDVSGDEFEELKDIKTPKEQEKADKGLPFKGKYSEITEDLPFTGVALAFEKNKWKPNKEQKKGLKNNLMALMFEKRIELAYSLKRMDSDIKDLPEIKNGEFNEERITEYFDYYDIDSLRDEVYLLK